MISESSNFLQAILARALAEGMYEHHLPELAARVPAQTRRDDRGAGIR